MKEKVILVDKKDNKIGVAEKMDAHNRGLLHRAVSVFIFNESGEILLQQRNIEKYHSGGLWSNAACTHPKPNESNLDAAERRLREEMGLEADLSEQFSMIYQAILDKGLIEHEFDHVFFGVSNTIPVVNPIEVSDYKYISYIDLITDIEINSQNYTLWFKIIMKKYEKEIMKFLNYNS